MEYLSESRTRILIRQYGAILDFGFRSLRFKHQDDPSDFARAGVVDGRFVIAAVIDVDAHLTMTDPVRILNFYFDPAKRALKFDFGPPPGTGQAWFQSKLSGLWSHAEDIQHAQLPRPPCGP